MKSIDALDLPHETQAGRLRAENIRILHDLDAERDALHLPGLFTELAGQLAHDGSSLGVRGLAWMINEHAMLGRDGHNYAGPRAIRGFELTRGDRENDLTILLYKTKPVGALAANAANVVVQPSSMWAGGRENISLYSFLEGQSLLRDLHADWYKSALGNPGPDEQRRIAAEVGALNTMHEVNPWGTFNREEFDRYTEWGYRRGPSPHGYEYAREVILHAYASERRSPLLPPAWFVGGDRVFESNRHPVPERMTEAVRPASSTRERFLWRRVLGVPLYYGMTQQVSAGLFRKHGWEASNPTIDRMRISGHLEEWAEVT